MMRVSPNISKLWTGFIGDGSADDAVSPAQVSNIAARGAGAQFPVSLDGTSEEETLVNGQMADVGWRPT